MPPPTKNPRPPPPPSAPLLKKILATPLVPEHHHFTVFGGFCRSGDHHFQNFYNFNPFIASHGRGSARSKHIFSGLKIHLQNSAYIQSMPRPLRWVAFSSGRQRRGLAAVPEPRIFTLKTAQARSGARIFKLKTTQARSGAPHFHVPEPLPHFSLCRGTYLPKFGVSTPPPPAPRGAPDRARA